MKKLHLYLSEEAFEEMTKQAKENLDYLLEVKESYKSGKLTEVVKGDRADIEHSIGIQMEILSQLEMSK